MNRVNRPQVALLSFAHDHAHHWARALRLSLDANLVTVWDEAQTRGAAAATRYGVDFEPDLDTLLARPDIDAVGICSENDRHARLTTAAAHAGKHVLCEKPMALTIADCDRMIAACEAAGVVYMQAFPQRHDPSNEKVKSLLSERTIGRLLNVRKRHGNAAILLGRFDSPGMSWFLDPQRAGGGAFLDEGVHGADALRWFLGEPIRVWAQLQRTTHGLDVEDSAVAVYEFPGEVRAVLETGWTYLASTLTTEIYGDQGVILQQGNDSASTEIVGETMPRLRVYSNRQALQGWDLDTDGATHFEQAHEEVLRQFVNCLRRGDPPPVSGRDGRQALAMILAGYESARRGKVVEMTDFEARAASGAGSKRG